MEPSPQTSSRTEEAIVNHELEGLLMNRETLRSGGVKREIADAVMMYLAVAVVVILSFPMMTYLA